MSKKVPKQEIILFSLTAMIRVNQQCPCISGQTPSSYYGDLYRKKNQRMSKLAEICSEFTVTRATIIFNPDHKHFNCTFNSV